MPSLSRACAVTVLAVSTAQADTIHVDADNCPGPGNGSELDPYCSIQTAIDKAVDTDEIVVAPGTYFETINFLGKAITLRSTDGPATTTIDALISGTVVTCASGEGPGTALDGFTLTNGANLNGGGVRTSGSSLAVTDCVFTVDSAVFGGAMFNENSIVAVAGCLFDNNLAFDDGGAVANENSTVSFVDCVFTGNSLAQGDGHTGGAIFNNLSTSTITRCTFADNSASGILNAGGGAIFSMDSADTLVDCDFVENFGQIGGALAHVDFSLPVQLLSVINCSFIGNSSASSGAMHLQSTNATVLDCEIVGNEGVFGSGGGVRSTNGPGGPSTLTMINTRISSNFAGNEGGGLANFGNSTFTIVNCTLSANEAAGGGGGIYNHSSIGSGEIENCVLWANIHSGGNGGEPAQIRVNGGDISVDYSCVEGWTGALGGTGNIDTDPLFVDPDNGDFHLQPGSPCIDAGDNTAVPKGVLRDLDGNPRFVADACVGDSGAAVDMGAYEFQGTSCDLSNMLEMLAAWGSCDDCGHCPADFDGDYSVGILDLLILLGNWG